ncbi:MAG: YdeI/OmpD-associated family protein [Cyclobacteriaceae bacterium]
MISSVNFFFNKESKWKKEYAQLRSIILACGLNEELKWGKPCYTFNGNNVVLIHGFKDYCALLFHKGALLKDTHDILIQQTENVQSARQVRFTDLKEIVKLKATIKAYVYEAIEVERAGLKVKMKKTTEFPMPVEFKEALKDPELKAAFKALTPGRQRGYLLYFSQAKQSKTRVARIEKSVPNIFEGRGYNER